ncbi:MAG: hypothetical protein OXB94_10370 [Nitrospira sp.]|nr:hypothetical protein [Nitrospira sp.]
MGISISESTTVFHVPFSSPNNEGIPEDGFIDLKAHPEWIPVLPSCIGWPELQSLLKVINAPHTGLMSLAADQNFIPGDPSESQLTSFVVICPAEPSDRDKPAMRSLADFLRAGIDALMHKASDALRQRLDVEILLELQPTRFRLDGVDGWSLTVMTSVCADETHEARRIWGIVLRALETALQAYDEEGE